MEVNGKGVTTIPVGTDCLYPSSPQNGKSVDCDVVIAIGFYFCKLHAMMRS